MSGPSQSPFLTVQDKCILLQLFIELFLYLLQLASRDEEMLFIEILAQYISMIF